MTGEGIPVGQSADSVEYETPLHEMVALAKAKGYAIDLSVYGGAHLDDYQGGVRVTGFDGDPMRVIAAGVRMLKGREPNADRETPKVEQPNRKRRAPASPPPGYESTPTPSRRDGHA